MAKKTQAEPVLEQNPSAGGRYVRQPDGSLLPADQAQPAPPNAAPLNQSESEPEKE